MNSGVGREKKGAEKEREEKEREKESGKRRRKGKGKEKKRRQWLFVNGRRCFQIKESSRKFLPAMTTDS